MDVVALAAFLAAEHEEATELLFSTKLKNRQLRDASDPFMIGKNFQRFYRFVKILYHIFNTLEITVLNNNL